MVCLKRELKEEVPGLKQIKVVRYIATLKKDGLKTPHSQRDLKVKIYLVKIAPYSTLEIANEITQAEWVNTPESYNLSPMTKEIIEYLRNKKILTTS